MDDNQQPVRLVIRCRERKGIVTESTRLVDAVMKCGDFSEGVDDREFAFYGRGL
jgi:hypothetical protein